MNNRTCSFEGCEKPRKAKGLCDGHFRQLWKGRKLTPLLSSLPYKERFLRKVVSSGTCWEWIGAKTAYGYGTVTIDKVARVAHRVAYELWLGEIPDGAMIDHRCHNKACVNPMHLRPVTCKQNGENRIGAAAHNSAGVRGVSWHKGARKWIACVTHNKKQHYAGLHSTIEEAAEAAKRKRLELFTHSDGR